MSPLEQDGYWDGSLQCEWAWHVLAVNDIIGGSEEYSSCEMKLSQSVFV